MVLWATLVYDPIAHWVWGVNGIIGVANAAGTGSLDFAGGTVVHIAAGFSALAFCLFLGKRKGYPSKMSPPHNLPFVVTGAALLWFGWFGFNAGSALGCNGTAANAFIMTHIATCIGGLTWMAMDTFYHGKPTLFGITSGAIAGLVGITPACGFVNLYGAIAIGLIAGVATWIFVTIVKPKLGYDDSLDVFNVHGVGGVCGAIATGVFATTAMNFGSGAVDGNWIQVLTQVKGVLMTASTPSS
jgi:Amt family ammonium transporter